MIANLLLGGSCFCLGILIMSFLANRYIFPRIIIRNFIVSKQQKGKEEFHWIHIKRIDGRQVDILAEDLNINPFDKDIIAEWIDEIIKDGIYV